MSKLQKTKPARATRKEKGEMKSRMSSFLMFLPNMFTLLGRLIKDNRVPIAEKALFAAAIVYVIMPLDFIPDFFPFIGQVDDIYVVALVLLRLINKTDESVVREHWTGGGDIVKLADSIAGIAPMILPKRVARILSAKVELAPDAGTSLLSMTEKGGAKSPIVIEKPQMHDDELIEINSGQK
jgi:uncharacterized membrane protein YkvA (DUF1232 family)